MALETLRGKNVPAFVSIDHDTNTITFKIQNGPIKVNGLNGCQVSDMVTVARTIIEGLNAKFPCEENIQAIRCLKGAEAADRARTKNRVKRGVEGVDRV